MKPSANPNRSYRRKACRFCTDPEVPLNYREVKLLSYYVTSNQKILPRRITGTCARHQRQLTQEIKRARILAYMPFTTAHS